MSPANTDDNFVLYDLLVEVVCPPGERILCGAKEGDHFILEGEMLKLPPGQGFSIYSLGMISGIWHIESEVMLTPAPGAILPLLSGIQRAMQPNDWMSTDSVVACPDPHCPSKLKIVRTGLRTFSHGDVTATPLPGKDVKI
ncbi:hypothetical protein BD410DRAFT_724705 [Rickenella mellea]|uniref:TIGR04076 family protein n=1 Tax=Rickenella mellea TaxID=50990 RepID=A0A4Y7Q133_9AGAM|nr:hypothetical protein BD410DRAFT_724705 [Rickenella mellea]